MLEVERVQTRAPWRLHSGDIITSIATGLTLAPLTPTFAWSSGATLLLPSVEGGLLDRNFLGW